MTVINSTGTRPVRILILGGGFGGVTTAQELGKRFGHDRAVEITLVNRDNYFVFVPLLASAAAGSIEALHVVAPIRRLISKVHFRSEEVTGIDLEHRLVTTQSPLSGRERQLPYDHLVLALGNVVNLSRLPGVAQHGKTIKTLGDALAIRNHVLQMLEAADIETDPATRREMLTFVVAGGGFSGVEMVGELNDLVREVIHHYPSITREQLRVILLHSNERILPEMSASIADYALKELRRRGVEVVLNARLGGATPHDALLEGGQKIPTRTLIVAVGNAPPPVLDALAVKKERGKIIVDEMMRVQGAENVWALGDNAIVPNQAANGEPSPPTAQYALRQGKTLAYNIGAAMRGGQPKPFAFGGLGLLCLIGHGAGVGELPFGIKTSGFLGFFLWRGVYWWKLPSLARRLQVAADWALDLLLPPELAQVNVARTKTIGQEHYEPGELIFQQGDPGDNFYLLVSGEVEVIRQRSDGSQEVVTRLRKGDHFGETSLLTRQPRNATIRCLTPVDVLAISREDFRTLAGGWLQLAESLRTTSDEREAALPVTSVFSALSFTQLHSAEVSVNGDTPQTRPAYLIRRDSGGEIALDRDLISVGRSPENNVLIPDDDKKASRRHAFFQRDGSMYYVEDNNSTNGVFVNNERLTERRALQNDDVVRIGRTEFVFKAPVVAPPVVSRPATSPAPPAAPAPPPPTPTPRTVLPVEPTPVRARTEETPPPPPPIPLEKQKSISGIIEGLDAIPADTPRPIGAPPKPGSITSIIESLDLEAGRPPGQGGGTITNLIANLNAPPPPVRSGSSAGLMLKIIAGPAIGADYEVGPTGATLGRARDNSICILDQRLSRYHARIEFTNGAFWLSDLGSANGTLLNQNRVAGPQAITAGDTVEFGDTRILVASRG